MASIVFQNCWKCILQVRSNVKDQIMSTSFHGSGDMEDKTIRRINSLIFQCMLALVSDLHDALRHVSLRSIYAKKGSINKTHNFFERFGLIKYLFGIQVLPLPDEVAIYGISYQILTCMQ